MSRAKKPKGDMTDRQLRALARLGRTKSGRQLIADCRAGIWQALLDGVGKP